MGVTETIAGDAAPRREGARAGYLSATHLAWLHSEPNRPWREVEATLVFADVSGFTKLAERLALRGRIGAEDLTEAITAAFNGMNEAIERAGGDLMKFGGDAVLALFTGAGHERRGAAGAFGMRDSLRAVRRLKLPAAATKLNLSAGVASGAGHLFLGGSDPRELIVAGPLVSEVVAMEGAAEAGQVMAAGETVAAIGDDVPCVRSGAGFLVERRPEVDDHPPPQRPAGADPAPGLPAHLLDHEPDFGEHRTATVAFLQWKGSDELLGERGPDALASALDQVVGAVASACREWGVTFVSSDIDQNAGKLILCAGAPTASHDDPDRIVHAVRDVVSREWPLPLRAGLNQGQIFTADIGSDRRRVWSVMGDTVNLAARVMGAAKPGQVLATEDALAGVRDAFERERVAPFRVKGKSAPVRAEIVGEVTGTRDAAKDFSMPFVGRARERGVLRDALRQASEGGRAAVQLVGEPGIGKSRLVQATLADAEGMNVVAIQGGPYGMRSPYFAMNAPLRAMLGTHSQEPDEIERVLRARIAELDPRLERWLPLIGIAFGLELEPTPSTRDLAPEFATERLRGSLARLIDLLLPAQPTLTVVEDAHWLDEATSGLIAHLLVQGRRSAAPDAQPSDGGSFGHAALITRRPVEGGLALPDVPGVISLDVGPLELTEADELATADDDLALPKAVRAQLLERAQGNPLLLQELIAAVRNGADIDELPSSVESLMTARIDTLPTADRRLLRDAAVLGLEVDLGLLAELVGMDRPALAAGVGRLGGFLVTADGKARWHHALLRTAAYETLSFRRRRDLHGRAGETIERLAGERAEERAQLLALHFQAAHRWPETWRYGRIAGEQALRSAAPAEAVGFLRGALESARHLRGLDPAEVAATAEALGDAAGLAGRYKDAAAAYAAARRRVRGDALAEAELCLKEGRLREESDHLSQALRWFTRGLNRLDGKHRGVVVQSIRARLLLAHGATRLRSGRLRECLPYLEQAVAGAEACGDRAALAHAYYLLEWAHTDLGSPQAASFRDLALPIFEELGDHEKQGRVLNNLGVTAFHEGHWSESIAFYERSREASERAGDTVGAATAQHNVAEILIDQGHLDQADELLREALATWRASGYAFGLSSALKNLARIATRRGELEIASDLFTRSLEWAERIGADALALEIRAYRVELLVREGEIPAALEEGEGILRAAGGVGVAPAMPATLQRFLAFAELAAGAPEAARERLERSAELARGCNAPYDEALALEGLARLRGDHGEAKARAVLTRLHVSDAPEPLIPR